MGEYICKGFKPYYNWNTFNTAMIGVAGIGIFSFKPYYNWNTFNTVVENGENKVTKF